MSHIKGGHSYSRVQIGPNVPDTVAPMSAPTFEVPKRKIVAVDHPCIVLNLENGLRSFGSKPNFQKVSRMRIYHRRCTNILIW